MADSSDPRKPVPDHFSQDHKNKFEDSVERSRIRSRSMRRAGLVGLTTRVFSMTVLVLTTPILVRSLGNSEFGIFITISSFATYLAFSDFGVGAGLLTVLGRSSGTKNHREMAGFVINAGWILIGACVGFISLGLVASLVFDIPSLLGASDEEYQSTQLAFQIFVVSYAIGIPLSLGLRVQQALQQGAEASVWMSLTTSLPSCVAAIVSISTGALVPTIAASSIAMLLTSGTQLIRVYLKHRWITRFGIGIKRAYIKSFLEKSGWLMVLQITAVVAFQTDLLVVSAVLGSDQAAIYGSTLRMFALVSLVNTVLAAQFWPATAEALANNDHTWVKQIHRRLSWLLPSFSGAIGVILILFGQPLIGWWLGDSLVPPVSLLVSFALWTTYLAYLTTFSQLLNGAGVLKPRIIPEILMATANIALSIYLTSTIGISGPPLASFIASVVFVLAPSIILVRRLFSRFHPSSMTN